MSTAGRLDFHQLTSGYARVAIWGYFAAQVVLAAWAIGDVRSPWPTVVALALFGAVCLGLTLDRGERLSTGTALAAMLLGPVMAALVAWQVIDTGFALWFTGASSVVGFYVMLRGRILLPWLGLLMTAAVMVAWGVTTGRGPLGGLMEVATQSPVLIVGTLFAIGLSRTGDELVLLNQQTAEFAAREAAALATLAERDARLAAIDGMATPLLATLVENPFVAEPGRSAFMVAEAELRDSIRARSLAVPEVARAAADARRRGVTVVLLDDSGRDEVDGPVVDAVVAALDSAVDGTVTARLLPTGRDRVATILVDGTVYSKVEL